MQSSFNVNAVLLVSTAEPDPVNFTVTTFIEGNQNRSNYVATYGSATRMSFPADSVYVTDSSQRDRAILVQAEEGKTISVYGVSEDDGFLALPCDGMRVKNFNRYEYVIFSGEDISAGYKSEFLIIPCEENTRIDITPSQLVTVEADDFKTTEFGPTASQSIRSATWEDNNGNRPSAGTTLRISHLRDLTGTLIRSNKPIVVISGHPFVNVRPILGPYVNGRALLGHLVEQIPPHTTWGCTFLLNPPPFTSPYHYYRVATVHNNTEVTITCIEEGGSSVETSQKTLNRAQGENWIELLTTHRALCIAPFILFHSKYCSLKASNPVIVAYYSDGRGFNSDCELIYFGSLIMSLTPPVTQYLNNYTVPVITRGSRYQGLHYIGISVYEPFFDPKLIMIDGVPVEPDRSAWQGIYCSNGEICGYGISKEIDLQSGDRTIYHEAKNAALSVQNYAGGSYGFPVGMELQPLSGKFSLILKHHFSFSITTQQQCNCQYNYSPS